MILNLLICIILQDSFLKYKLQLNGLLYLQRQPVIKNYSLTTHLW